jgi:hypothetical protein
MSYLMAIPGAVQAAAADVAGIGSSLAEASATAAGPTSGVLAAANDEVSTAIAALFSDHGKEFQALSARAAEFPSQFGQALNSGAAAYAATEAANAGPLAGLAAATQTPNLAISLGGFSLLQSGSATATSASGGLAIAFGAHSNAIANGGILNLAAAVGGNSSALSQGGFNNLATAFGDNSAAFNNASSFSLASAWGVQSGAGTTGGFVNTALAFGSGSGAFAGNGGNLDTALAIGSNSRSGAIGGSLDFGAAMGTGSYAIAGSPNPKFLSSFNDALVFGNDSSAFAGASFTTQGQGNLAVVFGNALQATATGVSQGINIVSPFFNAYWLPLSALGL